MSIHNMFSFFETTYIIQIAQLLHHILYGNYFYSYFLCNLFSELLYFLLNPIELSKENIIIKLIVFLISKSLYLISMQYITNNWVQLDSYKKSEKQYQHIYNETQLPVMIVDMNYRIITQNSKGRELFGDQYTEKNLSILTLI